MPGSDLTLAVQVDPETFAGFQAQGASARQQMSVALKLYAEAHRSDSASVYKE
jgi:hypothetical protein